MATPQQSSPKPDIKPGQLPAPGSLPKMPDSVVNYENKSLSAPERGHS
jgi:hypothetical protein